MSKGGTKVNEMKIKVRETNGDHQGYIEWIEKFDFRNLPVEDWRTTKNERRTTKNGWKSSRNYPRKRYGSASAWIFFRETIFLTNFNWLRSIRRAEPLSPSLLPLFIGKLGRSLPPSSPRRARLLTPEATAFWRNILEGPSGPGCYLYPFFTKYTPFTFLVILFP